MTYVELQAALIADGFSEGLPSGFSAGPVLDAEAAEAAQCAACGRVGLHHRPYHRQGEWRYVAVVVCPSCLWAEEC